MDISSLEMRRTELLERMKGERRPGTLFRLERQLQTIEGSIAAMGGSGDIAARATEPPIAEFITVREFLRNTRSSVANSAKLMQFHAPNISS